MTRPNAFEGGDDAPPLRLPRGRLVRSRVVGDPATFLEDALDRELTGYAVVEPADALLLDDEDAVVVTFADGVPVLASHTGSDRGGTAALAALGTPGPYEVTLRAVPADALATVHENEDLRVPPGCPADRLADDPALAARARAVAPSDRQPVQSAAADDESALAAFLDDAEAIESIREQASTEARRRAAEWGLASELVDDGHGPDDSSPD